MQKILFYLVLVLSNYPVHAQNLIPNPSFENVMDCPFGDGQIYLVSSWESVAGMTPDLIHTCANDAGFIYEFTAPLSSNGYQIPRSGNAYIGIYAYKFFFETATNGGYEYIETELAGQMEEGVSYYLEFYTSPYDINSGFGLGFSDGLGLVLTEEKLLVEEVNEDLIVLEPTISHKGTVINDTTQWTQIHGSHIATGEEKYASIGNFYPQPETLYEIIEEDNLQNSYYFIDDVSILPYNPLPDTLLLCAGETLNLDASFIHATDYLWNTGSDYPQIEITEGGKFSITAYVDTVELYDAVEVFLVDEENEYWVSDTLICTGTEVTLSTPFPGSFFWSTGDTTATILVEEPDSYTLEIDNECGTFNYTTLVESQDCTCNVFIPNAFSPNGDGVNDEFEAYFSCDLDYTISQFAVFDRWGNPLYQSDEIVEWDGTKAGNSLPLGEYVYYLEFEYYDIRSDSYQTRLEKGSVLLTR